MSAMSSVKESIDILKQAQELDSVIHQHKLLLEEFPEKRENLKQQLEAEKAHLKQLENELQEKKLTQKKKEGELAQKEGQIKKLEGQLAQVKTNKEYTAMQQEINSLKADNSILEEEIIKTMDEVEAAEEEVKKEKERLKGIEKDYSVKEQEMLAKEKSAREEIAKLEGQRSGILEKIDADVRQRYDQIVTKKHGLALARINGEMCGACHVLIRPQIINEVQRGQDMIYCESCQRILYIEASEAPSPEEIF